MEQTEIMSHNKVYWNDHADLWYGTTALPEYGPMIEPPDNDIMCAISNVSDKERKAQMVPISLCFKARKA